MHRYPAMLAALLLCTQTSTSWAGPARKGARPVTQKSEEQMTLDDYDTEEDENRPVRQTRKQRQGPLDQDGDDETSSQHRLAKGKRNFGSHTEINLGVGLAFGEWSASRTKNSLLSVGVQQLLIPAPAYVTVGVNTTFSPTTPRNFFLSANLGGGFMLVKNYTAPFAGFRLGATRLAANGRGRAFGMSLGPEIGFFPFRVGKHPFSLRLQYNWMAARMNGSQPHWAVLAFGFVF